MLIDLKSYPNCPLELFNRLVQNNEPPRPLSEFESGMREWSDAVSGDISHQDALNNLSLVMASFARSHRERLVKAEPADKGGFDFHFDFARGDRPEPVTYMINMPAQQAEEILKDPLPIKKAIFFTDTPMQIAAFSSVAP